jgi:hypothetical protein
MATDWHFNMPRGNSREHMMWRIGLGSFEFVRMVAPKRRTATPHGAQNFNQRRDRSISVKRGHRIVVYVEAPEARPCAALSPCDSDIGIRPSATTHPSQALSAIVLFTVTRIVTHSVGIFISFPSGVNTAHLHIWLTYHLSLGSPLVSGASPQANLLSSRSLILVHYPGQHKTRSFFFSVSLPIRSYGGAATIAHDPGT